MTFLLLFIFASHMLYAQHCLSNQTAKEPHTPITLLSPDTQWEILSDIRIMNIHALAFCPVTNRIAIALGRKVFVYDSISGQHLYQIQDNCALYNTLFSPQGTYLVTTTSGRINIWTTHNATPTQVFCYTVGSIRDKDYGSPIPYYGSKIPLVWISDTELLFCSAQNIRKRTIHLFNALTQQLTTLIDELPYCPYNPTCILVPPTNDTLILSDGHKKLFVYRGTIGTDTLYLDKTLSTLLQDALKDTSSYTHTIAFSPEGYLALWGIQKDIYTTLRFFDMKKKACIQCITLPTFEEKTQKPLWPQLKHFLHNDLVVLSTRKMMYIMNRETQKLVFRVKARYHTALSHNQDYIALAHKNNTVSIWNTHTLSTPYSENFMSKSIEHCI